MKLREIVSRLIIDSRKLTDYALNLENPVGRDKAVMFQRHLGFTQDEFSNEEGETIAVCTLLPEQFVVVWKSQTKSWLSVSEQLAEVVNHLSEEPQQEVLEFARSLYQR